MPVASGEAGQSAKSTEQNQIAQDAAKHAQEAARNAQEKQKRADEAAEVAREAASTPPSRVGRAEAIIHRNTLWSLGAGVVPVPIFDLVALTAVQLKMLRELSQLYEVPFFENTAKKLLGALVSSLGGVTLGTAAVVSLSKLLPGMGSVLGLVAVPVSAAAFTHATGRIFLMHFESGGTFLDFNPDSLRAHFRQEFERSKETVTRMKTEQQ